MNENQERTFTEKIGTPIIALLTLILTILALIPAFLSLNDKEAEIYYSVKTSHINIPSKLDTEKAISTLETAGIPGSTLEVSFINQGNTKSESIKFDIEVPDEIIAVWTEPSKKQNPIWVNIPDLKFAAGDKKVQDEIKDFSTTKLFRILVGYKHSPNGNPKVTVFSKGQPAVQVNDVNEVPIWSKWRVFYLPGYLFLGGVGLILIWSFIVALIRNPSFRSTLFDSLSATVGLSTASLAYDIFSMLQELKKNKNDKHSNEH